MSTRLQLRPLGHGSNEDGQGPKHGLGVQREGEEACDGGRVPARELVELAVKILITGMVLHTW